MSEHTSDLLGVILKGKTFPIVQREFFSLSSSSNRPGSNRNDNKISSQAIESCRLVMVDTPKNGAKFRLKCCFVGGVLYINLIYNFVEPFVYTFFGRSNLILGTRINTLSCRVRAFSTFSLFPSKETHIFFGAVLRFLGRQLISGGYTAPVLPTYVPAIHTHVALLTIL